MDLEDVLPSKTAEQAEKSESGWPCAAAGDSCPPVDATCMGAASTRIDEDPKKTSTCVKVYLVGATGFEPATSSSRTTRATKLRYAPTIKREVGKRMFLASLVNSLLEGFLSDADIPVCAQTETRIFLSRW